MPFYPDEINNDLATKIRPYSPVLDPVTCARNFEHMVQLFIKDVLRSNLMPIGEIVDFFNFTGLNSSNGDHLTHMQYFGYLVAYRVPRAVT